MRRVLVVLSTAFLVAGMALAAASLTAREGVAAPRPYTQVVDNASPGRFAAASRWGASSYNKARHGRNYRYARPAKAGPARFKVRIPKTGNYTVYARWPASRGYNPATAFGVRTTSGLKWKRVNQQRNGGRWVRLGTYRMQAGDRHSVLVSRYAKGNKYVIADAVKVVRSTGGTSPGTARRPAPAPKRVTGGDVVREAKTWLGVPYRYGGASRSGVDCSGLTSRVYAKLGVRLPRTAADQARRGRAVKNPAPGDLTFSNYSGGRSVSHVGIAVGNGRMINAPYPGTVVRYDPISPKYQLGHKRIVPTR